MQIELSGELAAFVRQLVESGRYSTEGEAVAEAVQLLREYESLPEATLEDVRREVQIGVDQIKRGEVVDGEEVFEELRQRGAALRRKRA